MDQTPATALRAWLDSSGMTGGGAAAALGVTSAAMYAWIAGKAVPSHHCRLAIEAVVGIPADSWPVVDLRGPRRRR